MLDICKKLVILLTIFYINPPVLTSDEVSDDVVPIQHVHRYSSLYPGPYFLPSSKYNVTAQKGSKTSFSCIVKQLGNRSITWIRKSDNYIIALNEMTFIDDKRYQVYHNRKTDSWTLTIRAIVVEDAGVYECQISTENKNSQTFHLVVIDPIVTIKGYPEELYVKSGTSVTLQCIISNALYAPDGLVWWHNQQKVEPSQRRTKTDIHMKQFNSSVWISSLIMPNVAYSDVGNYVCCPQGLTEANVTLQVINSENLAAIHHGSHSSSLITSSCQWVYLLILQQFLLFDWPMP